MYLVNTVTDSVIDCKECDTERGNLKLSKSDLQQGII